MASLAITGTLDHAGITPGTAHVTWNINGNDYAAQDNGAYLLQTWPPAGYAPRGHVVHATGEYVLYPDPVPIEGTEFHWSYQHGEPLTATHTVAARGTVDIQLPDTDIIPGTVWLDFPLAVDWDQYQSPDSSIIEETVAGIGPNTTRTLGHAIMRNSLLVLSWSGRQATASGTDNRMYLDSHEIGSIDWATGIITLGAQCPTVASNVTARYYSPDVDDAWAAGDWVGQAVAPARVRDDGNGAITGLAITGSVDYPAGRLKLNPTLMVQTARPSVEWVSLLPGGAKVQCVTGLRISPTQASCPAGSNITVRYRTYRTSAANSVVLLVAESAGAESGALDGHLAIDGEFLPEITGALTGAEDAAVLHTIILAADPTGGDSGSVEWMIAINGGLMPQWAGAESGAQTAALAHTDAAGTTVATGAASVDHDGTLSAPTGCVGPRKPVKPGSVRFDFAGKVYTDNGAGQLLVDISPATGAGTYAGTIDYATGRTQIIAWQGGANGVLVRSFVVQQSLGTTPTAHITGRVAGAPVRPGSFQLRATGVDGTELSVTAGEDGVIALSNRITGTIDYQTGVFKVSFGQWVTAAGHESAPWYDVGAIVNGQIFRAAPVLSDSIRYNAVVVTYLPMSADRIGLDPVRLPQDGRVPMFRRGDVVVIHHTDELTLPVPITPGSAHITGRTRLSRVKVFDADGLLVPAGATTYAADLDAGTITFASQGLDLTDFVQPLKLWHRIEDEAVVSSVDLSGYMALTKPLTHNFPQGSYVSAALEMGNLQARAVLLFTQATWSGEWSDAIIGDEPAMQFDGQHYTIAVANRGAIRERWALIFTSATTYRCQGENLGIIASSVSINETFSPSNPEEAEPYFTIPAGAFGLGGSAGNVFRFNTYAAAAPVWVALTVLPGEEGALQSDSIGIYIRGNGA